MSKNVFLILIVAAFISACGGTENPNPNSNTNQANLPAEFSNKPLAPSGDSTPGIPANPNVSIDPNGTPTPGIPHPANVNKVPRGTTPTPGIPDEKTLKQQMRSVVNGTVNSTPPAKVKSVRKP